MLKRILRAGAFALAGYGLYLGYKEYQYRNGY